MTEVKRPLAEGNHYAECRQWSAAMDSNIKASIRLLREIAGAPPIDVKGLHWELGLQGPEKVELATSQNHCLFKLCELLQKKAFSSPDGATHCTVFELPTQRSNSGPKRSA